ncbi:3-oxoacyl-ACP synthase III family protein [Prauserella flavalba]|uniref:3-oxoacyl-ACP synthase n=1 Tax=Prauserella flavalba TaxID=1477506 RepID=A0A318M5B3_9PSEU|nr:beta-ketoacyl-ACP synthase III [Prauserella flavalba]PXY28658.1 3-oxoacyl-ACP synthase [Prauserella flavalba]
MNTAILGTGSYLPDGVLTSAELGARLGVGEEWVLRKTGIRQRRVAAAHEATSDLGSHAAERALEAAGIPAADVDLIVLATSTKDQPMPATACQVQAKIGAHRAAAFDIDAVCTGFVYGLVTANAMLTADPERRVAVVIGADLYSRFLDYDDRRTSCLLGDGAGAVVLAKSGEHQGIITSTIGSDGTLAHLVQIPGGGSRRPPSFETVAGKEHYFTMIGREVRSLAAEVLPEVVAELLKAADLTLEDVELLVPHQANGVMLAEWAESLRLAPGQLHLTVDRYGNTGAASVPITLDDAVRAGRLSPGDIALLLAFGGGMTWGGTAIRWLPGSPERP